MKGNINIRSKTEEIQVENTSENCVNKYKIFEVTQIISK